MGPVCAHSVVTCCSLMALDATEMLTVAGFTLQSRPAHCLPAAICMSPKHLHTSRSGL